MAQPFVNDRDDPVRQNEGNRRFGTGRSFEDLLNEVFRPAS